MAHLSTEYRVLLSSFVPLHDEDSSKVPSTIAFDPAALKPVRNVVAGPKHGEFVISRRRPLVRRCSPVKPKKPSAGEVPTTVPRTRSSKLVRRVTSAPKPRASPDAGKRKHVDYESDELEPSVKRCKIMDSSDEKENVAPTCRTL
ncbi:hypothetical protein MSAN_00998600 [Mycena sanguinolenta]|uniref:Uncharacterized protein n=1 Tax=Mycena sanguinolenta TaxID=230812 RepID=A0A8H6YNW0_9AGAR|nr:hypothetical protein MSAN_00998600 [Mycena sanguinolenta]